MNQQRAQRPIGLVSLVCLVIGNMIGASVYVSSSYALKDLGDARIVLIVWTIGGVHAIAGAIAYGALAKRMVVSGGEYSYLTRCVHPIIGFVAGWISLLAGFTAPIAATALLFGAYVCDASSETYLSRSLGTAAIVVGATLHCVNLRMGAWFNNGIVFVKLLFLGVFVAVGLVYMSHHSHSGIFPGVSPADSATVQTIWERLSAPGMVTSMALSLFWISLAYTGFNASIYIAGEIDGEGTGNSSESGKKQSVSPIVGKSMLYACVLVTGIYLVLNYIFLYALEPDRIVAGGDKFVSDVALNVGGPFLREMMRAVIALSAATSIMAMVGIGPHVYARMAADGRLPAFFKTDSDVPRLAIILQAALSCIVVWSTYLKQLIEYLGLTLTACGALTVCTLWFAKRQLTKDNPLRWYEHLSAGFYVCLALILLWFARIAKPEQFYYCVATFASGLLVYLIANVFSAIRKSAK
jgi:amino acid transporter